MVSIAHVEPSQTGWVAKVDVGVAIKTYGPFRWCWVARLVAWLEDGRH